MIAKNNKIYVVGQAASMFTAAIAVAYYALLRCDTAFELFQGVLVLFAAAIVACVRRVEQVFIAIGFFLWYFAYAYQLYGAIRHETATWPLFHGSFYLMNELFVSCTSVYENRSGIKTHVFSRVGYLVFFLLDLLLNVLTVWYGTGEKYDDIGILPMTTLEQRVTAFFAWFVFHAAVTYGIANLAPTYPRTIKYFAYAFQFSAHAATVRLPVFNRYPYMVAALKMQTLANACWIVRFVKPDLPEPRWVFRFLMILMPLYCAWATTSGFRLTVDASVREFQSYSFPWMGWWLFVCLAFGKPKNNIREDHQQQEERSSTNDDDLKNKVQ